MKRLSEADSPEIRLMMAEAVHCLGGCGKRLRLIHSKEGRRNRGYCSLRCYYAKPPKMAYAEKAWQMPIRLLIPHLLNRYTVQASAELLGVEKWTLIQWNRKLRIRRVVRWEAAG